jgi:hypothetical protein
LGPNTLLNTLFSNTLSLRSSLNVSDQVSHPYKTTGKIIFLYILIFKFLDSNQWELKNEIIFSQLYQSIKRKVAGHLYSVRDKHEKNVMSSNCQVYLPRRNSNLPHFGK